jgi:hypothetical protein
METCAPAVIGWWLGLNADRTLCDLLEVVDRLIKRSFGATNRALQGQIASPSSGADSRDSRDVARCASSLTFGDHGCPDRTFPR